MNNWILEVIEYTDPYCTWCWASEPILRKINEVYGDQIKIGFRMGGLVADIGQFYDSTNQIGGENWNVQVADHWLEASSSHQMPVDERIWYDIKEDFVSTFPANLAFKAAQMQDVDLANKFLRKMREGAAAERKQIHKLEVQAELAASVGLDKDRFIRDAKSEEAKKAFSDELKECRSRGIHGFPTFLVRNQKGSEKQMHGFHQYGAFEIVFNELAGDILIPRQQEPSEQNILAFVKKYEKVAPKEVSVVFDISVESATEQLEKLKNKGKIKSQKAGNGWFYLS